MNLSGKCELKSEKILWISNSMGWQGFLCVIDVKVASGGNSSALTCPRRTDRVHSSTMCPYIWSYPHSHDAESCPHLCIKCGVISSCIPRETWQLNNSEICNWMHIIVGNLPLGSPQISGRAFWLRYAFTFMPKGLSGCEVNTNVTWYLLVSRLPSLLYFKM